jgi:endogenous inhibitor of DNA gyrase (YacG/DUF329 family)
MTQKKSSSGPCCLLCKKPQLQEFRPFCSARCKHIDLNRWFSEVYSIPIQEEQNPTEIEEEDLK